MSAKKNRPSIGEMPELSNGLDIATDLSLRIREFILTTYHNLPNTLFVAALLLGAIQGNLAMVWIAIGMVVNALLVGVSQEFLALLFPKWRQVHQAVSAACMVLPQIDPAASQTYTVAPSMWFASATYFVVFVLYNAIQVTMRPAAKGVDQQKVDVRRAFTLSVILLSLFFFGLILLRGLTGCETWLGSILGILLGSGWSIGYWHLLDICSSGVPPDILNIVAATAPAATANETPVICTA
jgi:hypothetical protein